MALWGSCFLIFVRYPAANSNRPPLSSVMLGRRTLHRLRKSGKSRPFSMRKCGPADETRLEGFADEDVDAAALLGEGDIEAGVDVLVGEQQEAKARPSSGKKLPPLEALVFSVHLTGR